MGVMPAAGVAPETPDGKLSPYDPHTEFHHARGSGIMLVRLTFGGPADAYMEKLRDPEEPDVLFTAHGQGRPAFGQVAGTRFSVPATDRHRATFIPYGVDSSVVFAGSRTVSAILFPPMLLADMVGGRRYGSLEPVLFLEDSRLTDMIMLLEHELLRPSLASDLLVDGISRAMAALLARQDVASIGVEADRPMLAPWRLRRVLDFIETHLDRNLGLDDLAVIADLPTFQFSRVFKRATGVSPYRYLRDRRLMRSKVLLADGRLSVAELALACGFANQSHFTAAFSKVSGISPARYRRQHRAHSATI